MLLVTGGAGFIGQHFLTYYDTYYPEEEIVCVDALTYASNINFIKEWSTTSHHHFIQARIENKLAMNDVFKRYPIDRIVNIAAESHVDRSLHDTLPFIKSNIEGVQVLLDLSLSYDITRFHQVSTDEVYGDLSSAPNVRADEHFPLLPNNPYAVSKAAADMLVQSYYHCYNLPTTISRGTNTYGIYQHEEKLIPHAIQCALKGEPIPIYGNGKQIRDWLHVEDHVQAIDCILRKGTIGTIYNVGANNEKTTIEVITFILQELNIPYNHDTVRHIADRLGHDKRYALNSTKLITELDWKPKQVWEIALPKIIKTMSLFNC